MKYLEIVTKAGNTDTLVSIAEDQQAEDIRVGETNEDGRCWLRLLVSDDRLQDTLDKIQQVLDDADDARLVVLPVEISLPKPSEEERREEDAASEAREALYEQVEKGARLNLNYCVLVVLSTIVAAIGLVEDNVAVVIGAMVIAPLLGPNLAFGLGTALGDVGLMRKSALAGTAGVCLAVLVSILLGLFWPFNIESPELLDRTRVGMDSIALALASGAAAALSLTTGLSATLVGVMVAVALLPPAAALGLMLGHGQWDLASGACLLLAINVVCVNLATKLVFFIKGIRPRSWWEKKKSKKAMLHYVIIWVVTLVALAAIIWFRDRLGA